MPRPADFSKMSHADLIAAVTELVAQKRITADEVRNLAGRKARIAALERELAALRGVVRKAGRPRRAAAAPAPAKGRRPGFDARGHRNTPKMIAARKLQGRYIGALSKLSPSHRNEVKAIAKKDGVAAAVKHALDLRKGSASASA